MNYFLIFGGVALVGIIVSFFFEQGRDFWFSIFEYMRDLEWFSDIGEFISGMFENMGELSMYGLLFGGVGVGTIFLTRNYMLVSFTKYMSPVESLFWTGATYIMTFVAGYFIGKHFENSG